METVILIGIVVILYGLAAIFSGSEAALFSLKDHELELMGSGGSRMRKLLSRPRSLLIVILASNLLVNTLSSALIEGIAHNHFGDTGILIAIGVASFLLMVFGEILPQTYALQHNALFSRFVSPIVTLLLFIWKPVTVLLVPLTTQLTKHFEGGIEERITEDDIKSLVTHSKSIGALDVSVQRWIHSIFQLDKLRAFDIMIPRDKIFALPKDADYVAAMDAIRKTRYSRIPLYAGTLDQIVGVLYAKDMLAAKYRGGEVKPARIAREPVFVPRWKRCDLLLNDLRGLKTHMAVVVDEFGGVCGLITLESIHETIVGKMRDAHREGRGAAHRDHAADRLAAEEREREAMGGSTGEMKPS